MSNTRKTVLGFTCESDAAQAGAILSETPDFEELPFAVVEQSSRWVVECYDDGALASFDIAGVLAHAGVKLVSLEVVSVPDRDWVSETQKMLPPVRAGRFIVHGSHDRERIFSLWSIEIDAGRAFGTAHHGTTEGCLRAIAAFSGSSRSALDLGTGSGVLAIAIAKARSHRAQIAAVDIDPIAIDVAGANCRKNGVAGSVRLFTGDGFKPSEAYVHASFDLVTANILAKPLLRLAPRLRQLTKLGGLLILSGLLSEQAREILGRYLATGFYVIRRQDIEGWATLVLRRGR